MPGPRSHHGLASGMKALTISVMKSPHRMNASSVLSSGASSKRCCAGSVIEEMVRWRCGAAKK